MNDRERKNFALVAQDAYNYFLAAGGQTLQRRHGESAFGGWSDNRLKFRIEHLEKGIERLNELAHLCRSSLPHAVHFEIVDNYDQAEDAADIVKYARLGVKAVAQLCKRFRCDPETGLVLEDPDHWRNQERRLSNRRRS